MREKMSKLSFIHTADLHLDSPFKGMEHLPKSLFKKIKESTFASFTAIIDIAIKENVDFILVVGDIFDGENRSLMAQNRFRKELERLQAYNIQVYVSHGNHDHLGGNWIEITWPANVHIFQDDNVTYKPFVKNGVTLANIYGFSYPKRAVQENKTRQYAMSGNAKYHIGMLHGNVDGNTDHDSYAPFKVEELVSKNFSYWALGHIHKRQVLCESPPILYPGNIQGRHKKELGEKGCYLVELEEGKVDKTFIPTAPIIWEEIEIAINDIDSYDDLCLISRQKINERRNSTNGKLIQLRFVGKGKMHSILQDKNILDEIMANLNDREDDRENFLWVASMKEATSEQWDRDALRNKQHFTGEVLKMIDAKEGFEEAVSSLFNHRSAMKYLDEIDDEKQKDLYEKAESLLLMQLLRK
jgi:DNA repair protein SbcD/Mre11